MQKGTKGWDRRTWLRYTEAIITTQFSDVDFYAELWCLPWKFLNNLEKNGKEHAGAGWWDVEHVILFVGTSWKEQLHEEGHLCSSVQSLKIILRARRARWWTPRFLSNVSSRESSPSHPFPSRVSVDVTSLTPTPLTRSKEVPFILAPIKTPWLSSYPTPNSFSQSFSLVSSGFQDKIINVQKDTLIKKNYRHKWMMFRCTRKQINLPIHDGWEKSMHVSRKYFWVLLI